MRSLRASASLLALLSFAALTLGGQDSDSSRIASLSIDDLIGQLGSPVYSVRERAQEELWNRGESVVPALEKALGNTEPEIARRASALLNQFSWGIRSDTPAEILNNLRQFQAGDWNPAKSAHLRTAAITALLQQGPRGLAVVRAILANPLPPDIHEEVVSHLTRHLRREVPLCLFEGRQERANELLSLHLSGTGSEGAADFAAFQLLQGKLDEAIAAAEQVRKSHRDSNTRKLILAHLYRARGDWNRARAAALELATPNGVSSPLDSLREEEGDWQKLADTTAVAETNHPDAVLLTYLRLAGQHKAFDNEVKRIRTEAAESTSAQDLFDAVVAMFANHRFEDGTRILVEHHENLGLLAEALISQLRFKQALELVSLKKTPEASSADFFALELRRARLWMQIGKTEDAVGLYDQIAKRLRTPPPQNVDPDGNVIRSVRSLIRAEVKCGLKDLACRHAAMFLASPIGHFDGAPGETCLEILFGPDSIAAEALFAAMVQKKEPASDPCQTMTVVRDLLCGKALKTDVDQAIAAVRKWPEPAKEGFSRERTELPRDVRKSLAIAAICRSAARDVDADEAYQQSVNGMGDAVEWLVDGPRSWVFGTSDAARPWMEWGDYLCGRGRFAEAAQRYEEGWRRFPDDPVLLFLSGKALTQSGDSTEGSRRVELSHWVSLGQERLRGRFLDELVRRGEAKAALREANLILQACWPHNHYFGNVMNQAARSAVLNHNFALAETCVQRSLLVILRTPGVYFVEPSAYLGVPHDMLVYKARSELASGKVEHAMALAREALSAMPGHIDLVCGMVADLDKLGKKAEADELFQSAWAAYEAVLAEFPDSPFARHALASLAAGCRRELSQGLDHAEDACRRQPENHSFQETLAEIHFRNGNRDRALEIMRRRVQEEPRNPLFTRQLQRYRNAPPESPKPERADD